MSDNNQNENKTQNDDIGEQLNELGKNLRETLRTAWESDDRRKLQQEIETGLTNLRELTQSGSQGFHKQPGWSKSKRRCERPA